MCKSGHIPKQVKFKPTMQRIGPVLNLWDIDDLVSSSGLVDKALALGLIKSVDRRKTILQLTTFATRANFPVRGHGFALNKGHVVPAWTTAQWVAAACSQAMPYANYWTCEATRNLFEAFLEALSYAWRKFEKQHGVHPSCYKHTIPLFLEAYKVGARYHWNPEDTDDRGTVIYRRLLYSSVERWLPLVGRKVLQ